MTIFNAGDSADITSGLMNLNSVKQMIFCIAQEDNLSREMNAYDWLGVSNILEHAGHEIEKAYDELFDEHEVVVRRYRKMQFELSVYIDSHRLSGDSELVKILADGQQEGAI